MLDDGERLNRDELAALQLTRLQASLRRVYERVPFYRQAFDSAGVHPTDCRGLSDLARFPFTTKADLRANYPHGMLAVPREQVRRIHASSGTTGVPTVVGYTERDLSTWSDLMARSIRAAGGRRGDTVHVAYGYGLFTGGLGAHYGAERLGCTVIPASGGMTARQVRLICDLGPDIIMVTPSYLLTILDEFDRQGVDPRATSLRTAILGAEPWTEQMRTELEERLDLDAVDIFGLSEVMGPGVACECVETKDGPTIWEDHFLAEAVDPETGRPVAPDQQGELVLTTLTREALPLIRYRTRDLTRLLPGTARVFRRMQKVMGRTDDMMIVRGVNVFPTQIEEIVLAERGLAPHFQLVLDRAGRLDSLTVQVESRPGVDPADRGAALAAAFKDRVGVTVAVDVVGPGTLQRSTGKLQRVIDRRPGPAR